MPATEGNTEQELSAKGRKEITLQKKRRFDRAIDAAQSGYLLAEDEGTQPFDQAAAKKRKLEQQDAKRIDKMAACNQHWKNVSQQQTWNWKSLGAEKAWSTTPVSQSMCRPLVLLEAWFFFLALKTFFFSSLVVMHPPARTLGKRRFSSAEKPSLTKCIFWLRHVVGASSPKAL